MASGRAKRSEGVEVRVELMMQKICIFIFTNILSSLLSIWKKNANVDGA